MPPGSWSFAGLVVAAGEDGLPRVSTVIVASGALRPSLSADEGELAMVTGRSVGRRRDVPSF